MDVSVSDLKPGVSPPVSFLGGRKLSPNRPHFSLHLVTWILIIYHQVSLLAVRYAYLRSWHCSAAGSLKPVGVFLYLHIVKIIILFPYDKQSLKESWYNCNKFKKEIRETAFQWHHFHEQRNNCGFVIFFWMERYYSFGDLETLFG